MRKTKKTRFREVWPGDLLVFVDDHRVRTLLYIESRIDEEGCQKSVVLETDTRYDRCECREVFQTRWTADEYIEDFGWTLIKRSK